MSKTFLTQCPHCRTRFRVNSQQLFAAQGAVRCGSCMQVFNARLFLEQDPEARPDAVTHPDRHEPASPAHSLDSLQIHDDMDIDLDSPDFEQELARLARQEAQDDLHDAALSTHASLAYPEQNQLPVRYESVTAWEYDEDGSDNEPPLYPEGLAASRDYDEDLPAGHDDKRREPAISTDDFDAIDDGPLLLEWQPKRRRATWLWSLLSLLAALGLAAQYVHYNTEQLARQPATRPWVEAACSVLGCRLPGRVDVDQITSSNLVVRPHAEFANALSVDAIIYNRAAFAQPFPLLQLNFMDDSQQVLASRNFSPQEYLGGELAGRSSMPAQTPIRIALDVLVPDARATGYNLRFLSPE